MANRDHQNQQDHRDHPDIDRDWQEISAHLRRASVLVEGLDASAPELSAERVTRLVRSTMTRVVQHDTNSDCGLSPAAPAQSATAAGAALLNTPSGDSGLPASPPNAARGTVSGPAAALIEPPWSRAAVDQLVLLLRLYREWTDAGVADALGRPVDDLVPSMDGLTVDFVSRLADGLDWTVADVIDAIGGPESSGRAHSSEHAGTELPDPGLAAEDFSRLDVEMAQTYRAGRYHEMLELAERARRVAQSPEERATVCNRMSGAWDGLGYYDRARREARRGLEEPNLPGELRTMLMSHLANAHYTQWEPFEAQAIATGIIEQYGRTAPTSLRDRRNLAWARYVRGNSYRRLVVADPEQAQVYATQAKHDLKTATDDWRGLAEEYDHEGYHGIAHTCVGGGIELDVTLGQRSAEDAIEELRSDLAQRLADGMPVGDGSMLESCGWWCVFAGNIATRHLAPGVRNQAMEGLLETAYLIAAELPNWALRERVFSMEHALGRSVSQPSPERVRLLVGTMGRFRRFRSIGWQMLGCAG